MEEKILSQLKTACGQNTSISDKTLQIIAHRIAANVTEESQIEAAIEIEKPILQAIDGNINFVAADAVKKVKPIEKTIEKKTEEKIDPNEPDWFKSYREKQEQETTALKNKLESYDKEKAQSQLNGKITAKLKEKGIPESYYKGRNLNIESEDGIDQLISDIDTDYSGFKQELAEQGVIISVPRSSAGELKEGEALGKAIAEKKNTGSTEGVQGKKL